MHGDEKGFEDGPTLAEVLRDGPLTVDDAIRTASAVADAVSALHAAGRAHGGFGPDDVVVGSRIVLLGPDAPKTGLAAPPALRALDLQAVCVVLAAAVGWPRGDLPRPVAELLERAERSAAPAAALADALHGLRLDPAAMPDLLPPRPAPSREAGRLVGVVPRPGRRTTGVAVVAVASAAVVGAALLLVGAPAGTGREPAAAAAVEPSAVTTAPEADAPTGTADPTAAPTATRSPGAQTTRPTLPARRSAPSGDRAVPPSSTPTAPGLRTASAAPTPRPTATATASSRPTTPASTAPTVAPPSTAPTTAPTPTAQPSAAPPPTQPAPAPTPTP